MRRITWTAAFILALSLILAACGSKDADSVVKELDKVVNSMESYQASGTMKLHTGTQPLTYNVEVSYLKPTYYRIKLTNAEKDITQIVLRNDEGVFVLTPRLNKVFRFQSDWPQSSGQVYLYQTLAQSILVDNSRQFTIDEKQDAYVFDVMANYNVGSFARQKIWLNKSDYRPVHVEVSDTNAALMVEVNFDKFDFGAKFDSSDFDTEANMKSSASPESGTSDAPSASPAAEEDKPNAQTEEETDASAKPEGDRSSDASAEDPSKDAAEDTAADAGDEAAVVFVPMLPEYTPDNVEQKDMVDIVYGGNPGVMTMYTGDYDYTLIQTQPKDVAATVDSGTPVELGFTLGQISGMDQRTLTWTYEGNLFRLTSETLPESEMIKIAQSVQGEAGKP
ncbi:outer membrane lipoprotein carrier protein LolA [Paenibacillus thailandensis]|uniref:Outer membrane lipoprotein carrier protein LolA n=1 Tax=Paenibacillus thailandensis TaxID=393250 RepID=A0ABW5QUT2_9BACL